VALTFFFAQATPPTGWSIDTAHKDNVLACKADSGTYSTVGADKGDFAISIANMPEHYHGGGWQVYPYANLGSADENGIDARVAATYQFQNLNISYGTNGYTARTQNRGSSDGHYRPKAALGVIATYTG